MILRSTVTPRVLLRGALQPVARLPSPSRTSTRQFSLWPSSSSQTPDSPTSLPESATTSPVPVKPSLSDFLPPASIPDPTFLEPLSTLFLSLPPSLSLSYAAFIPLFTLFYRSLTTLPVVLWQRRRTRRFVEHVVPRLKKEQAKLEWETRDECRGLGKSYEEYQKVFKQRAKKLSYLLARQFRCSPRLTLLLPPLVHIPIFITATLTLRDACSRAAASLPLSTSDLSSSFSDSYLSPSALQHLHDLASTSVLWCPSLVLPDPTMFLPLGVGIVSLLNVELSAKNRLRQTQDAEGTLEGDPSLPTRSDGGGIEGGRSMGMSASEKRRMVARKARDGEIIRVRGYSTTTSPAPTSTRGAVTIKAGSNKPNTARIVTNVLRFASVAFIPVAGLAPSAICLYWIASNLFTMVQNGVFAVMDRKREREKRVGMILKGRVSARGQG
ncbi:membrane insertase COX18 [Sporobolomyces salmoneus]|uniref:membrane insertase COX18 n=1 Tax=Sporobolomyces salmoneus TaxID=183962 RepID=UPI003178D98B